MLDETYRLPKGSAREIKRRISVWRMKGTVSALQLRLGWSRRAIGHLALGWMAGAVPWAAMQTLLGLKPFRCPSCQGTGWVGYRHDPSAAGVSLSSGSMVDLDPCSACLELGFCPSCGRLLEEASQDGDEHCEFCGWDSESGSNKAYELV